MIVTATQGVRQNEPSLPQNLQAKSRADLSRHVDAGVDSSLLRHPRRSQCEEPDGNPILPSELKASNRIECLQCRTSLDPPGHPQLLPLPSQEAFWCIFSRENE